MKKQNYDEYKIILVADNNTGKTSLFKKITSGEFSPQNVYTIDFDQKSIEFIIRRIENEKKLINIILVDTAGQKRYADLTKSYFKGCNGILLLYSIIDKNKFILNFKI
jgi:small GTP-binding protein